MPDVASRLGSLPIVQNTTSPASVQPATIPTQVEATTVFVNAANYPMGALAVRDGIRMNLFGGPGFQPVVVDLKE